MDRRGLLYPARDLFLCSEAKFRGALVADLNPSSPPVAMKEAFPAVYSCRCQYFVTDNLLIVSVHRPSLASATKKPVAAVNIAMFTLDHIILALVQSIFFAILCSKDSSLELPAIVAVESGGQRKTVRKDMARGSGNNRMSILVDPFM